MYYIAFTQRNVCVFYNILCRLKNARLSKRVAWTGCLSGMTNKLTSKFLKTTYVTMPRNVLFLYLN